MTSLAERAGLPAVASAKAGVRAGFAPIPRRVLEPPVMEMWLRKSPA
jgi:hypothetical protein